ncbi:MAG: LPS translocon maturation chaperone LptM [Pseudomonadota bacterium]
MRFAAVLLILCALQGCGQKGPLTLPTAQPQASETQQPEMQRSGASSSLQSQ